MGLLIVPTLLDQYDWLMKCPQSWKEKAYADLSNTLNRAPFVATEAITKGMKLEDDVCRIAVSDRKLCTASKFMFEMADAVGDCDFQVKLSKNITIDGQEYYMYGKADAIKKDRSKIIDLKTTGNYRGPQSYLSKWQHRFYTYMSGITNFDYVIAVWDSSSTYKIGSVETVNFVLDNVSKVEEEITQHIRQFISFVESDDSLCGPYYTVYNRYGKKA